MRTNAAMTIFNKYVTAGAETWASTQIKAVKWEQRKGANVIKSGMLGADSVTVFIPLTQVEAYYIKPIAWQALNVKTNLFTFQPGDFVVRGLITETISTEFTISDLKKKYDDTVKITSVDLMDAGSKSMHHFQLGCS